jgi:hypothetical protein
MKIILFWSEYNNEATHDEWVNKEVELSPLHLLALTSHSKFNNDCVIYSYQKIINWDDVADASKVLDSKIAYRFLKSGHNIAHISDYVRMKVASEQTGIILDMDAVSLRKLSNKRFFSSMPAKKTGAMKIGWGKSHPPLKVYDNSWDGKALSCFPTGVDEKLSPYIKNIANKVYNTLTSPPKTGTKAWNYVMWDLKMIPYVVESDVYEPIYFCPLPAWKGKGGCYSMESPTRLGNTELFGYELPSIDEIFEKSYIVQHFFESSFKCSSKMFMDYKELPNDCLLFKEYQYIYES